MATKYANRPEYSMQRIGKEAVFYLKTLEETVGRWLDEVQDDYKG